MIFDSPKTLGREDFLRLFAEVDQILVSNNPLGDAIKAAVCGGAACLLQFGEIVLAKEAKRKIPIELAILTPNPATATNRTEQHTDNAAPISS